MRRAFTTSAIAAIGLLVCAAVTAGCGSDSAKPDGGGGLDSAGGSGGPGGTGGGAGGAAMMMNCPDLNQPIDPTGIIDDMETPDYMTVRMGGRSGAWWAGGDPASLAGSAVITPNG